MNNTNNKQTIADNLKRLRADRSREEIAASVGISVSALQMYENAQRVPKDEIKVKLANYFGVSVQEIFFDNRLHELCS
ncbi:helix-turn-helix transcriptional regulator [Anaerobacillus sp. CMMVII]|uniref:helix-turn-helix transcriptional regulator n=1 Tax=Anaerobacillus sp. CMMVII TaxID=2755588 RepID=UPI0021B73410|nr:helix-turn-helix transcriptional regulator [Anaerobacillus sp. CMMVII]MCT8138598.1 helix-turn-helix transcriptional regulator [Anaerobacillus sp. CMMVII]